MLIPIFLPLTEKILNSYLSSDLEVRARLQKISGRLVRLEITGIDLIVYLTFNEEKIHLLSETHDPIDASLKGNPFDYTSALIQSWQGAKTPPQGIEISGDIHLIQTIHDIFRNIDIDWEEILSHCTGDIVAHQIGNFGREIKNCFVETADIFQKNFREYLQEEAAVLAPRLAVDDFYDDVYQLHNDVERAAVKLAHIEGEL